MDDAAFKLGYYCSEAGHLVSRKNDIRFELAITPWQAPWGLPRGDTVYFTDPDNPIHEQYQQIVQDSFCLDLNHLRVFGKAAFNFLAFSKGMPFVLADKFDSVRNWIAFGGEPIMGGYNLTTLNSIKKINLPVPEDAHFIYITKAGDYLIANVLLSNLNANIVLSDSFNDPFQPIAFFCDWKNHNEYDLREYLLKIHFKDLC